MNLHELIDPDEPKCLYCNSDVDVNLTSEWVNRNSQAYREDKETITCHTCNEIFVIHSWQGDDGHTLYIAFTFSCNGIVVYYRYNDETFYFTDSESIPEGSDELGEIKIPSFSVDFSDKGKLYKKLKTYLIFS